MQTSSRLYHCCRCHAQVIVCSRCDHGQRYCAGQCRHEARSDSLKRAARKYQSSRPGRFNNADRQQRFRQRNKQIVTHQGSPQNRPHDLLKVDLTQPEKAKKPWLTRSTLYCHYCDAVCEAFLSHEFLHSTQFKQTFRRHPRFHLSDH